MGTRAPRYTIILAAGEGTRMGSTTHHKVCYPIKGQPAVNRAIEIYNKCGIEQHILVVGALAGQVIETVGSAFENVIFAYQAQRLGTAHAAIKFGRKGKLGKVTFYDFSVPDIVPFPNDYALVVCDSGVTAKKTGSARDLFNHRICCYGIGFLQIKKYFPQYAAVLHHLRDVNLNALNIPLSEIYRILLRLPEGVTRDELRALLPDEDLDIFFNQHHPPDDGLYPIRGVILFGLAEIDRMVHISLQTEGVVGAQLAGAGLGGCVMVLAQRDAVSNLVANLTRRYYQPQAKEPTILVCRPVAGSAVLMRDGI